MGWKRRGLGVEGKWGGVVVWGEGEVRESGSGESGGGVKVGWEVMEKGSVGREGEKEEG